METRAHHLLIGLFVLVSTAAMFGFLVWFVKGDFETSFTTYDILFEESVTGLQEGSDVLFNGIPVGRVMDISIPDDPSKVRVRTRIESDVPIREDAEAVLSLQGLTGVLFVQIEGGDPGADLLEPSGDGQPPVIPSRISPIQSLTVTAPDLITATLDLVSRAQRLLTDENVQNVASILSNVETASGELAQNARQVESVLASISAAARQLEETSAAARTVADKLSASIEGDLPEALQNLNEALAGADRLIASLNTMVERNEPAITNFSNSTLPEISLLVSDARRLAGSLTRLAEELEEDPASVLFSKPRPEYNPE